MEIKKIKKNIVKVFNSPLNIVATLFVLYQLLSTQFFFVSVQQHQVVHLTFAFLVIYLAELEKKPEKTLIYVFGLALIILCGGYLFFQYEALINRMGFPVTTDVVIGFILILLILLATYKSYGITMPLLAALSIIYAFWGYILPYPFTGIQYLISKWISKITMLQGIFGNLLSMSASYLFLFIVFGAMLQITGGTRFFEEVGKLLSKKIRGGAALTALVTSALTGMLSGSVTANVSTTGSFTIPSMKKIGYSPEQAGAIEAAASTAGQIIPPVMGAAAFIMAGMLGLPYIVIMKAAIIPSILYILGIGLYIYFQAGRMSIALPDESCQVNLRVMLKCCPVFLLPVVILIVGLSLGYTPSYVIFWAIVAGLFFSILQKETRPSLNKLIEGFTQGAKTGADVAIVIANINILITVLTATGAGIRLPRIIEIFSGNNLFLALLLTMIIAIILGIGLPTSAVYILVTLVVAPVLTGMGLLPLVAHFFIFFWGVMSFVTPPVAVAVLVASKMSGGKFSLTALETLKAAIGGFIVPWLIIGSPWMLLLSGTEWPFSIGLMKILAAFLLLFILACLASGFWIRTLSIIEKTILIFSGLILFLFTYQVKFWMLTLGIVGWLVVLLIQMRKGSLLMNHKSDV